MMLQKNFGKYVSFVHQIGSNYEYSNLPTGFKGDIRWLLKC